MSRRLEVTLLTGLVLALAPAARPAQAVDGPGLPRPWQVQARPAGADDVPEPGYVENQLLVRFKPGTSAETKAALHARYGGQVIAEIPQLGVQVLRLYDATAVGVMAYQANSEVQYAEPNYLAEILGGPDRAQPALMDNPAALSLIPNDPYQAQQWHHAKIRSADAWDRSRGQGVTVAIVDTGVACNHPDLSAKCVAGYDFVNGDSDPRDDHGHGTHVAGIAGAATNNSIGVAAVGFDAKIMPMKALGASGNGGHAAIAGAITWAADHGAQVINMSLGGPFTSTTLRNAVAYAINKGATMVAAAGNENTSNPSYPAAYANVIGVSATTQSDGKASFSNYGDYVDVAAPGTGILSTVMSGSYQAWSGTSMASPVVAGLVALLEAQDPSRSPAQMEQILESTADDLGPTGWDPQFGYGRVNALRALSQGGTPVPTATLPRATSLPATPSATPTVSDDCVQQVEDLLNRERAANSLPPLYSHDALRAAAARHAVDMANTGVCSHTGSDNSSPYDRMRDAGYGAPFGEIVACGQTSAVAAVQAWMNSDGHRALILCAGCTELGAGCRASPSGYRNYWVVNFGSGSVGASPTPTVRPAPTNTPLPPPTAAPDTPTPTTVPTDAPDSRLVELRPGNNRIGWVASNEPNTNHFDDTDTFTGFSNNLQYHGAMQFDLDPIPAGAYVNWARLEMTGRTREFLADNGTWTVNILTSDIDPGFAVYGYARLHAAYIESTLLPYLGVGDLGTGFTNVFNFAPAQRTAIHMRLASTRRISFRMDGPASGTGMNLFTWDSGYGPLSLYDGPKLVINYSLTPPTAAPTATATDTPPPSPTATEGPPPTSEPTQAPPTATFTAPPPPPTRTPTATEPPPLPTSQPILEIRPSCPAQVGWARQGESLNHLGDDNIFTGFYQGLVYHGMVQFNLSGIPQQAHIVAARLTLTGQSTRYLATAGNGLWQVKLLTSAIDGNWQTLGYNQIHSARELSDLVPQLRQADLGVGVRNVMVFTPEQLGMLQERVATTQVISFRVDGPSAGNSNIMDWFSGCGPGGSSEGPVLQVQFGSLEPGEPTATDAPESVQKGLEMIEAINATRQEAGLAPLQRSDELMTAARVHNLDISSKNLFTHIGSDGSQPEDRVRRTGFRAEVVGEVLAMGSTQVPSVLAAWMARENQRAQFLRPDLTHIGAHWTPAPRATIKNYWTVVTAKRQP